MKAIHYIYEIATDNRKQVQIELEIFDQHMNTLRDLSKGPNNKLTRQSTGDQFEKTKDIEIEEGADGSIVLTNL